MYIIFWLVKWTQTSPMDMRIAKAFIIQDGKKDNKIFFEIIPKLYEWLTKALEASKVYCDRE